MHLKYESGDGRVVSSPAYNQKDTGSSPLGNFSKLHDLANRVKYSGSPGLMNQIMWLDS